MRRMLKLPALAAVGLLTAGARPGLIPAQDPVRRGSVVEADTVVLTAAGIRQLALARGLALDAERRLIGMAAGELRQARVEGINPTVEYQRYETGGTKQTAEYGLAVSQDLGWLAERGPRIGAAHAALDRTIAEVDEVARVTVLEAGQRFVESLAALRRQELAAQMVAATERLYDVTRIQLQEGEISLLEANLAEIELGRARARALRTRRESTSALLELRRLIGMGPDVPVRLVAPPALDLQPAALVEDALVAAAIQSRPDLAARRRAVEEASLRRTLATREALPAPRLSGFLARDAGDRDPRLGVGISVPLTLLDRNQGRIERETLALERSQLRVEAGLLAIRLEVREARLAYLSAREESASLEARVLEPARANVALLDSAYQAGKLGLPTLLLLRNQLFEAELDYWRAWQAEREALLRLQAAIGLPPGSAGLTNALSSEDTP